MEDSRDNNDNRKRIVLVAAVAVFVAVVVMAAIYLSSTPKDTALVPTGTPGPKAPGPTTSVELYFPIEDRLEVMYRTLPKAMSRMAAATATVEEFLRGPDEEMESAVPKGAKLLNIYDGDDGVLYLDISDEFRRNFQGDVMGEFLLLRGLYESILANVDGVAEIRVLIEGEEADTLGGHLSLLRPLGYSVSQTMIEE